MKNIKRFTAICLISMVFLGFIAAVPTFAKDKTGEIHWAKSTNNGGCSGEQGGCITNHP